MAYPDYTEGELGGEFPPAAAISATMGWIGAACSLALVIGVGWWVYELAQRDANGVPVIAALEGPARMAPDNPGGFEAANQGLSVNANSSREMGAPVEQVTLAPEPTPLDVSDQPISSLQPGARDQVMRDAVNNALQDAGVGPAATAPAQNSAPQSTPKTAPIRATPALGAGVPRPRPRPDFSVVSRRAAPIDPIVPEGPLELDPADIPAGTRLVQLGAFASADIARSEWVRAEERFGPFLQGKQRVIERTERGGKVFYRLRVHGFDDLPDARRFCAALEAEKADCIPVLVR